MVLKSFGFLRAIRGWYWPRERSIRSSTGSRPRAMLTSDMGRGAKPATLGKYYALTETGRQFASGKWPKPGPISPADSASFLSPSSSPSRPDQSNPRETKRRRHRDDRDHPDRHLFVFSSHLSRSHRRLTERDEIVREISAHIRDSAEESGVSVETILARLGSAEELAAQYRDGILIRQRQPQHFAVTLLRGALRTRDQGRIRNGGFFRRYVWLHHRRRMRAERPAEGRLSCAHRARGFKMGACHRERDPVIHSAPCRPTKFWACGTSPLIALRGQSHAFGDHVRDSQRPCASRRRWQANLSPAAQSQD